MKLSNGNSIAIFSYHAIFLQFSDLTITVI